MSPALLCGAGFPACQTWTGR